MQTTKVTADWNGLEGKLVYCIYGVAFYAIGTSFMGWVLKIIFNGFAQTCGQMGQPDRLMGSNTVVICLMRCHIQ